MHERGGGNERLAARRRRECARVGQHTGQDHLRRDGLGQDRLSQRHVSISRTLRLIDRFVTLHTRPPNNHTKHLSRSRPRP